MATKGLILVPALQVGIIGCTQPDRVPALVGPARDGLAPRFLWAAPEVQPTAAMANGSGPMDAFEAALARLVRIEPVATDEGFARPMPLSPDARAPLEAAAEAWIKDQLRAEPALRDILARARQQAVRLAAVLALLEHALAEREGVVDAITAVDAERGIALVSNYFLPMAERTFAMAGTPRETDTVRLARFLRRLGRSQISLRDDVYRGAGSPVRTHRGCGRGHRRAQGARARARGRARSARPRPSRPADRRASGPD